MAVACTRCCVHEVTQHVLGAGFRRLGLLVGRWPRLVAAMSVLVSLVLFSVTAFRGEFDVRIEYLYVPRHSPSFRSFEADQNLFGRKPREAECTITASDGGSMLRSQRLEAAWRTYQALLHAYSAERGVEFGTVCKRSKATGNCTSGSLFGLLGLVPLQPEMSPATAAVAVPPDFSNVSAAVQVLRAQHAPELGPLLSVDGKALRFTFPVVRPEVVDLRILASQDGIMADVLAWETAFLDVLAQMPPRGTVAGPPTIVVDGMAVSSMDKEVSRNMTSAMPFMGGAIALILTFLALLLGGKPFKQSRLLLAVGAVATIILAEGAGFGITTAFGTPLTDVSLLLIFIAVGIGVDDIIILTDSFDQQDQRLPEAERLAGAMEHGGVAIFLTSFTNLVAFLISATTDFPSISWFCIAAAWVVLMLLLFTILIYSPLLVLDERRRAAGRYDCCVCVGGSGPSTVEVASIESRQSDKSNISRSSAGISGSSMLLRKCLTTCLVPITTRTLPACLWTLTFFSCAVASCVVASLPDTYKVGIPLAEAFPDDSYLTAYLDETLPQHFGGMVDELQLVVEGGAKGLGGDESDASTKLLQKMNSLAAMFSEAPQAVGPVDSIFGAFASWENCTVAGQTVAASGHPLANRMRAFLAAAPFAACSSEMNAMVAVEQPVVQPARYVEDVAWGGSGNAQLRAAKMRLAIKVSPSTQVRIDDMKQLRELFTKSGVRGFAFASNHLYADRDDQSWVVIKSILIFAGVSVVCAVLIFVHPLGAFLIAVCVAVVDSLLFGGMALWAIPIDALTFCCLAMAVGLSVDYVVHLVFACLEEDKGEPSSSAEDIQERVARALRRTGASVLKGATSTFLGIFPLSMAPAGVFRIFFKMFFMIVLLGVGVGFVLFPSMLTLCLQFRNLVRQGWRRGEKGNQRV